MTVDLEWLVYFGMYTEDFSGAGDTTGKVAGRLGRLCASPAGPAAVVRTLQLSGEISSRSISASAAKEIPVIVSSLVFLFEKSFK